MAKDGTKSDPRARHYFNQGTQDAIVQYQSMSGSFARDRLFVTSIHPALDKLVENLINIHRFTGEYDSHDDLKSDCITFLYESLHKFDAARGTNAFSYFNIVAKHWLIVKSKKRVQRQKRNVSLHDGSSLSHDDLETIEQHNVLPPQDAVMMHDERIAGIVMTLHEIRDRLKAPNELACIDAIIGLFELSHELDLLTKSASLVYIREMSGLSPKQLTVAMHAVRKLWHELRDNDDELFDF